MSSTSERPANEQTRTYDRAGSVVFLKTDAPFGGLSNMAGGFPLHVHGTRIYTSEALYQACRFPHLPEVQRLIIGQASPMTAKMKSKPHRKDSRPDWDRVRVKVMRWCLRVKLAQNWAKFSDLLLRTGDRPIVEESRRDDFWGAKAVDDQALVGMNVLGRLLMELREAVKLQGRDAFLTVEPPDIPEFLLLGQPIMTIGESDLTTADPKAALAAVPGGRRPIQNGLEQASLFDAPSASEAPSPVYTTEKAPECALLRDLKPYPTMKDSGVPWLGRVPAHWATERAKWLFRKMNRPVRDSDEVVTCFRDGTVTLRKNRRVRGFTESLKEIGYQGIRRGDLVIHAMDAFAGAIGVADADGKGTPVYSVCEPGPTADSHYYAYVVREMARSQWIQALAKGIRERSTDFRFEDFGSQLVPLPPLPEQTAIVRFLDHADRRIRRYIRAKQKLIKLLEEQKQAIIQRAVTRGLDPNVRLKPSGVEWLGDVPEHWQVVGLRYLATKFGSGVTPRGGAQVYQAEGVPFLRSQNVHFGGLRIDAVARISRVLHEQMAATHVRPSDVLLNITGASIGRACAVPENFEEGNVNQHVCIIRPLRSRIDPRYLAALLSTPEIQTQIYLSQNGSSREGLTLRDIRGLPVLVPPLEEQRAIIHWAGGATAGIDGTITRTGHETDLLREYRTRLIADVVTGKLDVHDAAARLPREAEDLEPLDEAEVEGEAQEADAGDADDASEEVEA